MVMILTLFVCLFSPNKSVTLSILCPKGGMTEKVRNHWTTQLNNFKEKSEKVELN